MLSSFSKDWAKTVLYSSGLYERNATLAVKYDENLLEKKYYFEVFLRPTIDIYRQYFGIQGIKMFEMALDYSTKYGDIPMQGHHHLKLLAKAAVALGFDEWRDN
jgi:hypothetical protein